MDSETSKPSKYERFKIETKPAPHIYEIPNKFDVSANKIRLAAMLVHEALEYRLNKEVVLSRPCIYGVFGGRFGGFKPIKQKCVGCMRCVQEYPHIMTVRPSKQYRKLGDSFWTPEAVFTIWNESSTGKIPVKGMGYKGAFGGEGFDGIWTDMSEIVRPTRDGVYGREFISTTVDIGRKPTRVDFERIGETPPSVTIPVPIIIDQLPVENENIAGSVESATDKLGTFHISNGQDKNSIPVATEKNFSEIVNKRPSIVEFESDKNLFEKLTSELSSSVIVARTPLGDDTGEIACKLAREGVHGFHFYADYHGKDYSKETKHVSASLKEVHRKLVKEGLRDQVTVIASGGVTLAEHVPKAIICGADLVGIDTTVMVALQAEFLGETRDRANCQMKPCNIDPAWGAQRLVNLFGVWHDQLIEILSAMGMRDVRRLRGDIGRSMMDSELREQSFKGIAWAT